MPPVREQSPPEGPSGESTPIVAPDRPDQASSDTTGGAARPTGATATARADETTRNPDAPYYQLYLLSGREAGRSGSPERIRLTRAKASACAAILETLYVPVARSGSADAAYLLYEQPEEMEAARQFAAHLDVATVDATPSATADVSFAGAVGVYYGVLAQNAIVDKALVKRGVAGLSQVAARTDVPQIMRWAAAILAGRLAGEYAYAFEDARGFFVQAERLANPGSLEEMTARWWKADVLEQLGRRGDARAAYQSIVDSYGGWRRSQIVRRASAKIASPR